ncbi:MAG: chemotaxis protein CheW, partial [Atribacterota bacterium]
FGLIQGKRDESTRIIVAEIEEKKTGLIVDAVEGVEKIPQSAISTVPEVVLSGESGRFIKNVARLEEEIILILDLNRIFSEREIETMAKILEGETKEEPQKRVPKKALKRFQEGE